MKDFIEFKDDFVGAGDLTDRYGVEGAPTVSAVKNGAVIAITGGSAQEKAVHLDDKRQIEATQMTEFSADFELAELAGVAAGNSIFIGLIGADYATALKGLAKYAAFEITDAGITFVADDDVNVISELGGALLSTRVNRITVSVARGWEQAEVSVNGKPVGGYHDLTGIRGESLQLVAQVKGSAANGLALRGWSFKSRKTL